MSKYVIHACPQRMWYVNEFLLPSLRKQGIKNVSVRCDNYKRGNLYYCMDIFSRMHSDGGTWHIQDDVIVCRDFARITNNFTDDEIVCGFGYEKDPNIDKTGYTDIEHMWYSFPCIYIPNYIARECSYWFFCAGADDPRYLSFFAEKQHDDYFFLQFLREYHPDIPVLHLKPNLVDHVDYLIGGTTLKAIGRGPQRRAKWFNDIDLVEKLEIGLRKRNG